ncbi:hypothetical protein ENUP19_0130G0026 [Entamoeba nuttalli]|uniref:Uncharacterized protein n=1 Tax=Entamoeba nuttalli TaxID=412467 RepID=A0ABQ0DK41_9EUKA
MSKKERDLFEQLKQSLQNALPQTSTLTTTLKGYDTFRNIYPDISDKQLVSLCGEFSDMLLSVEPKPISNTQHYLNSLISRQIGQEFKETEVLSFQTLDFYEVCRIID